MKRERRSWNELTVELEGKKAEMKNLKDKDKPMEKHCED